MKRTRKIEPSRLKPWVRRITAAARAAVCARDALIADVELDGDPPELGPPREITADEARRRYREAER